MVLLVGDDEVLIKEATHWWYFGLFSLKKKNAKTNKQHVLL